MKLYLQNQLIEELQKLDLFEILVYATVKKYRQVKIGPSCSEVIFIHETRIRFIKK